MLPFMLIAISLTLTSTFKNAGMRHVASKPTVPHSRPSPCRACPAVMEPHSHPVPWVRVMVGSVISVAENIGG